MSPNSGIGSSFVLGVLILCRGRMSRSNFELEVKVESRVEYQGRVSGLNFGSSPGSATGVGYQVLSQGRVLGQVSKLGPDWVLGSSSRMGVGVESRG